MEQSFDISLENSQTPINTIIGKVLLKKKCFKQSYEGSIPVRLKNYFFSFIKNTETIASITLHTLTSLCIFSILFSIHFLKC